MEHQGGSGIQILRPIFTSPITSATLMLMLSVRAAVFMTCETGEYTGGHQAETRNSNEEERRLKVGVF